ncbi:MAG: hypothetical protein WC804_20740 [Sphingomonas sp.]|jgi:hypothetical protein|uniref:hypothetical protein n=1 Tax=Sphingomonas sp. TaxID=28214 RepID=UPI00356246E8
MDDEPEAITQASTAPVPLSVTVSGLVDTEKATEFAHLLAGYMQALGTVFDISRLEALTATDRYTEALTEVDRGFPASATVTRSENEDIVGIAMCVHVLRAGVPRIHLVCDIEMVLPLWVFEHGTPEHAQALQLLAHECAHIEDMKRQDDAYPGVILQQAHQDWLEAHFMPIGSAVWQEYYACRRSANFYPDATTAFATSLATCLDGNQAVVNEAIRRYRQHHDLGRLVAETLDPATRAIKVAAYLFGHLDGLDQGWDAIPEIRKRLDDHRLNELMEEMVTELQRLWDMQHEWTGVSDMEDLVEIARDAYAVAGVVAHGTADGGAHLSVPFTDETT